MGENVMSSTLTPRTESMSEKRRRFTIGVCAMEKKTRSKAMQNILTRLLQFSEFEIVVFTNRLILTTSYQEWPVVDIFISFYSTGFPLLKAMQYVDRVKPCCINDLQWQQVLLDRRLVLKILDEVGVPTPDRLIVSREKPLQIPSFVRQRFPNLTLDPVVVEDPAATNGSTTPLDTTSSRKSLNGSLSDIHDIPDILDSWSDDPHPPPSPEGAPLASSPSVPPTSLLYEEEDFVELNGQRMLKPFVEKPVHGENHNVYIYYDKKSGAGGRRLFRKIANRSSTYAPELNSVRRTGSYIYETFMNVENSKDVKVYTVGPQFAYAESRKSPVIDGIVQRTQQGRETRQVTRLTEEEKDIARRVSTAFRQSVCGFDLLRVHGKSYVCDVNGWSFVKGNHQYYDACAMLLRELSLTAMDEKYGKITLLKTPVFNREEEEEEEEESRSLYFEKYSLSTGESSGRMLALKGYIGVYRHADRTPKQKLKVISSSSAFIRLFYEQERREQKEDDPIVVHHHHHHRRKSESTVHPQEIVLKSTPELRRLASRVDEALREMDETEDSALADANHIKDKLKLEQLKLILRRKATDVSTKVQMRLIYDKKVGAADVSVDDDPQMVDVGTVDAGASITEPTRVSSIVLLSSSSSSTSSSSSSESSSDEESEETAMSTDEKSWLNRLRELFRFERRNSLSRRGTPMATRKNSFVVTATDSRQEKEAESFIGAYATGGLQASDTENTHLAPILAPQHQGRGAGVDVKVLIVCKWGGEFTHAGVVQSRELGTDIRRMLQRHWGSSQVHRWAIDVHSSPETRVTLTAQYFMEGFFQHKKTVCEQEEKMPASVPIQISKDMLDDSGAGKDLMDSVKFALKAAMMSPGQLGLDIPWHPWLPALTVQDPLAALHQLFSHLTALRDALRENFTQISVDQLRELKWCCGENALLFRERWERLYKNFCDVEKGDFDISKIPDLYDNLKYDVLHCKDYLTFAMAMPSQLPLRPTVKALFEQSRQLCQLVSPLEFGMTPAEMLGIARKTAGPLVKKIGRDLREAMVASAPCLKFYFTKESFIYTLFNYLSLSLPSLRVSKQQIVELDYSTQINFELYEDVSLMIQSHRCHTPDETAPSTRLIALDPDENRSYFVKLTLSMGSHCDDLLDQYLDHDHSLSILPTMTISDYIPLDDFLRMLEESESSIGADPKTPKWEPRDSAMETLAKCIVYIDDPCNQ